MKDEYDVNKLGDATFVSFLLVIGVMALCFAVTTVHIRALEKRVDALEQAAAEQKRP